MELKVRREQVEKREFHLESFAARNAMNHSAPADNAFRQNRGCGWHVARALTFFFLSGVILFCISLFALLYKESSVSDRIAEFFSRSDSPKTEPLLVWEEIPVHGAVRCHIDAERVSKVGLVSQLPTDCLVELWQCGAETNLAYDVFVRSGMSVQVSIAEGTYRIYYTTGDFWKGYTSGLFRHAKTYEFPKQYDFTAQKGVSLKLTAK